MFARAGPAFGLFVAGVSSRELQLESPSEASSAIANKVLAMRSGVQNLCRLTGFFSDISMAVLLLLEPEGFKDDGRLTLFTNIIHGRQFAGKGRCKHR